jgi:3-hydroxybutyryl-CoA dehydrogenase
MTANDGWLTEPQKFGVVGAGVIGIGVAQVLAASALETVVVDVSEEHLERARRELRRQLRLARMLQPKAAIDIDAVFEAISFTTSYDALRPMNAVIENVTEKWPVKAGVYRKLDTICQSSAFFAVNTSVFSIARVAELTSRPDRVVGIHFMNPVPLKPTAEVIPGPATSDETMCRVQALLDRLGKRAIVVGDAPGFVSNRVMMLTIAEAIRVFEEGTAGVEEIDRVFVECFDHAMGPLATADLIGLDTILLSLEALEEAYEDQKFRPPELLRHMVAAGRLGCKTGQGFKRYFSR